VFVSSPCYFSSAGLHSKVLFKYIWNKYFGFIIYKQTSQIKIMPDNIKAGNAMAKPRLTLAFFRKSAKTDGGSDHLNLYRLFHLLNCRKWKKEYRLLPFLDEDYEKHWNRLDCSGTVVLDLGADYGSTAKYFIERGAARIVAVEGDPYLAQRLKDNCKRMKQVTPITLQISSSRDVEKLIRQFKPQIVKCDLEGDETFESGGFAYVSVGR
jgi:hypothetical protein